MATRPSKVQPGRTRLGGARGVGFVQVGRGKKALVSKVSDEERRANFKKLESARIEELQRVAVEKATLATSPSATCSKCGAPVHRGANETRTEAKPLCARAHAVITESHADLAKARQAAAEAEATAAADAKAKSDVVAAEAHLAAVEAAHEAPAA